MDPSLRPMSQTPIIEKRRNYRFYAGDPAIHPAEKRLYANGDFEGTPLHVSGCSDPRDVTRPDRSYLDLPVPKFKLDRCWVGVIPAKEVTFRNLNDNITKTFLTDMCKRFGEIDDCRIYYDRQTKKHLGLGTVIFKTTKAARECVAALHMSTKMGSIISVSLETSGKERTKQYATLIRAQEQDKAAQEKALAASAAASPPPPSSNDYGNKKSTDRSQTSTSGSSSKNKKFTPSKSTTSKRNDSRTRHPSSNDPSDQFSFDPYRSFGTSGTNSDSHRTHRRSRQNHHSRSSSHRHRPSSSSQSYSRRRSRRSRSSSRSSSSTSHSSSSSRSRSSKSSTSSSTSRSYSSSSSSSRSSSSRSPTPNHKRSNDFRMNHLKQQQQPQHRRNDDEDHRPSLDERIAALFQQQNPTNTSSSQSSKTHNRSLPLPNVPPPSTAYSSYPAPPHLQPAMASVVGSHSHQQQQSYGVVNNFNFFGNSFPPASFLNSTGGTNWQDMFKQPPPLSSSTMMTTTTTTTINYPSTPMSNGGLQPHPNDTGDERERKTHDLTTAVSNIVTGELVEILRKDLAKKLIETLVYKSIESWFDNEERKDKIRKFKAAAEPTVIEPPAQTVHQDTTTVPLQHSISNPSIERVPEEIPVTPLTAPILNASTSNPALSTYFDQLKDSTGLPVRTQMPKIPSFKKRPIPEEKPVAPVERTRTPIPKKEKSRSSQPTRPQARKRLRSSTSPSSISSDTEEDSRSQDSALPTTPSETKTPTKSTPVEPPPPPPSVVATPIEEEEGEIKEDDDDDEMVTEEETKPILPSEINGQPKTPPPPAPVPVSEQLLSPTVKKTTTAKKIPKEPKEPKEPKKIGSAKKRKTETVSSTDNTDNQTPVKRKKSASNPPPITPEKEESKPIQTFNLLDSLPEQTTPIYNRFAYISIEHNYAIMAKQPVPIAKRLTADGLNDLGIQIPPGPPPPLPKFPPREHDAEMRIMYDIDQGIDEEDMNYLKQSFQILLNEGHSCTMKTRWVDHPATRDSSLIKSIAGPHRTGCARTEGYYKIVKEEIISPIKTSDPTQTTAVLPQAILDTNRTTGAQMSRELRSENRRNLVALGDAEFADHFKFSQLKMRKKRLRYAKSSIHSWGLFACEPIAMEDMVIEYVGETIRQSVGDLREKKYELEGINSNYMFRIDSDTIVDATKCGNLARFINHSCDPNCYAKIIPVESQKKIVIYSRRDIRLGEEITYDYKFPLEEQKIPCRCGTPVCRGSLN